MTFYDCERGVSRSIYILLLKECLKTKNLSGLRLNMTLLKTLNLLFPKSTFVSYYNWYKIQVISKCSNIK